MEWLHSVDEQQLYLSILSLGEIYKGIVKLGNTDRAAILKTWLETSLKQRFAHRIVAFDETAVLRWGEICGHAERNGQPLPAIDSQIAAMALEHQLTLITRNTRDFVATGVRVHNPWAT